MGGLMWLDVFNANPYGTNCWLLASDASDDAVVVDPGFAPEAVHGLLAAASKTPVAVLATHAHFDHAGEAGDFAGELPVFVHEADAMAFTDEPGWRAGFANPLAPVKELRTIADGDMLRLAGLEIEVMHTPGHTPGHCSFRVDTDVVSARATWCSRARSVGRTSPTPTPTRCRRACGGSSSCRTRSRCCPGTARRRPWAANARPTRSCWSWSDGALAPRGTQDLLPDRADAMLGLYDEAHRIARLYGYRYLETPTFEQTELFSRTSGETSDVVTKEMYTFEDKGGRSVTLRPESTAGVVRAYLTHAQALPNPFKGYYVASEFRHGRPQAGRMREFRQFGIEVIGTEAPGADVEVIVLGDRYLRSRGLRDVTLHLNSIGDEACRPAYRERLVAHFEPYRDQLDEDCRDPAREEPPSRVRLQGRRREGLRPRSAHDRRAPL